MSKDDHATTHFPTGKHPTLRVKTRPNDANATGDIFGGWLMSQIDIAGAIAASERAHGPVVTVAVKDLTFLEPLYIYDVVSFYTDIVKVGTTSLMVKVEAYAQRRETYLHGNPIKVSTATLVYVAVYKPGEKREVPK